MHSALCYAFSPSPPLSFISENVTPITESTSCGLTPPAIVHGVSGGNAVIGPDVFWKVGGAGHRPDLEWDLRQVKLLFDLKIIDGTVR